MADLSKTISNSLNLFGQGPSSKWASHTWNSFRWGEGTVDIKTDVLHLTGTTLNIATVPVKLVYHLLDGEILTVDSTPLKTVSRTINVGTITLSGDMYSERLQDGSGYQYVFPSETPEGETRAFVTWTQGAGTGSSWATAAVAPTTWSEQ